MNLNKEQIIDDLHITEQSASVQDNVVNSFIQVILLKIKSAAIDSLDEKDQAKFVDTQDDDELFMMIEKSTGGDIDKLLESVYQDTVKEFNNNPLLHKKSSTN